MKRMLRLEQASGQKESPTLSDHCRPAFRVQATCIEHGRKYVERDVSDLRDAEHVHHMSGLLLSVEGLAHFHHDNLDYQLHGADDHRRHQQSCVPHARNTPESHGPGLQQL